MRPTGVTLIAIYHYLGAVILALLALAMVVGGTFLGAMFGRGAGMPMGGSLGFMVGIFGAIICLFGAAISGAAGYGVWALREWGRILCIVLAVLALLFSLPGLFTLMLHFGLFLGGFRLMRIVIEVLIIWYLTQPQVRALFQRAPTPAPPPPM